MRSSTLRSIVGRGLVCLLFSLISVVCADTGMGISLLTAKQKTTIRDQAFHILGGNVNVTSRWTKPIRFAVVSQTGDVGNSELARQVIDEVAGITSLPVIFVESEYPSISSYVKALRQSNSYQLLPCSVPADCANFVVVIADVATMTEVAKAVPLRDVYLKTLAAEREVVCFFSPFQKASVIHQAMVFVRSDLSQEMISTCLYEEVFQSFGLFNDYTDSEYFSFNNRVVEKSITDYDRRLLEVVYRYPVGSPAFVVVGKFMESIEAPGSEDR